MTEHIPAAQAEAEGVTTIGVTWRDLTFTILTDADEWPVEATLALEEGHPTIAIRELLGKTQFAQFMATKPRNRDAGDLFSVIALTLGLGSAGE
jgi:hypothetical protein